MTPESSSPLGQRIREKYQARTLLARMHAHENVADRAEHSPVESWRNHHRDAYRHLFGIDPSQRTMLRAALEEIAVEGHGSVAAAIQAASASPGQTKGLDVGRDDEVGARSQDS